jgi:hypothetical protein
VTGVQTCALPIYLLLIFAKDLIPKGDHPFIDSLQPGSHNNGFIISSRIPILAIDIRDNEFIPQSLQISILESPFSTKLGPPYFKPNQVIRIISHSHLVCLCIPHSKINIHDILHSALLVHDVTVSVFRVRNLV